MQTFSLTGEAVTGLVVNQPHLTAVSALPDKVCLGRQAIEHRPPTLRLESFVNKLMATPPAKVDWYSKAAVSIARMYLNDRYGDCVFAGKGHNLGIWSANDPDSAGGQVVLCTDKEISDQYFAYTGGRDNGANISQVLTNMVRTGFLAGGKRYKLRGYCAFDWRSKELTQVAIALGGALSIGFNLPGSWMNSAVWDTSNAGQIVGGHDVSPCGYGPGVEQNGPLPPHVRAATDEGVIVASWGRLFLITWPAWQSTKWIDECYFQVPETLWTGLDQKAPSGVNLDELLKAMDLIKAGQVPPLPDPTPAPPPVPDPPPVAGVEFTLPGGGRLKADFNARKITYPKANWTAEGV
jgi:hypothetical protein